MSISIRQAAYKSGDAFLPTMIRLYLYRHIIGNEHTLFYLNYWSIIHFLSGVLLAFVSGNWMTALLVHTLWEIWQRAIGMSYWNLRGSIDTVVDTVLFMAGHWLTVKALVWYQG
jgi:hypothetical protein